MATTAIVSVVVTLPAPFVAVTVYDADAVSSVGFPVIVPFCELRARPCGSAGLTDHVGKVPDTVGTAGVMAASRVSERVDGEYEMLAATGAAVTSMFTVALDDPVEFVAVTA